MTEREIAEQIASGVSSSPQSFMANTFFAVRISGTGVAWRPSIGEYVYRDPAIWLTQAMCQRVAGVPAVAEHPEAARLDGEEFYNRVVGIIVLGFVRGEELWGVIRVIDKRAADILDRGDYDTSPGVMFEPGTNATITLDDGSKLLVEGNPSLLDHLALVFTGEGNQGVWSKNSDAIGVEISKELVAA